MCYNCHTTGYKTDFNEAKVTDGVTTNMIKRRKSENEKIIDFLDDLRSAWLAWQFWLGKQSKGRCTNFAKGNAR